MNDRYIKSDEKKGIHRGLLVGAAILASIGWGVCTYQNVNLKDDNSTLENKNIDLKTKVRNDSMTYNRSYSSLQKKLEDKTDTFTITDSLYRGSIAENKNLNSQIRGLKRTIVNLEKALKISENLEDPRFQELLISVKEEHMNALNDSMSLDSAKYADLEAKFNNLYDSYNELYEKGNLQELVEQNISSFSPSNKEEISFDVKHRNALYALFVNVPRLKAVGEKSFIFRNDNPKETEAWVYLTKTKRLIPLTHPKHSGEYATFPHPYFGDYRGPFEVHANDIGKEKKSKSTLYIYDGVIYTKKNLIPKDKIR